MTSTNWGEHAQPSNLLLLTLMLVLALAVTTTLAQTGDPGERVLTECASCFLNPPTNTQIPLIGTAPLASIYALRIFGPTSPSPCRARWPP
jgi:hypothetical protein